MPRIFGNPSAKSVSAIRSKGAFVDALRSNDQAALHGIRGGDPAPDGKAAGPGFGFIDVMPGIRVHKFHGFDSYLKAATSKVWCLAKAVDITANVVISTEMSIESRNQEEGKKPTVRVPPELARLLENPNPHDTISELLYLWVGHMKLTGNAFWFKDEINVKGQPKSIFALNPRNVEIVPSRTSKIAKYLYRVNGNEIEIDPEEMIHFKRPNWNGGLLGVGDVEQGESLYNEFINRSLYAERVMQNGARPSSVLVKDDFQGSEEEWARLKARFNDQYGGVENTGKVAWLTGKWSLLQLGITAHDMQEMEKAKMTREEIFINSGVPLSVAGFGAANYATSKTDDILHRKNTCLPLINWFADRLNAPGAFIQLWDPSLKLDFKLQGLIDVEQVMRDYGPLWDRGGLTSNELRVLCGLPKVSDPLLDQRFIPGGMVPLELAGMNYDETALPPPVPAPSGPTTPPAPGAAPLPVEGDPAKPKRPPVATAA